MLDVLGEAYGDDAADKDAKKIRKEAEWPAKELVPPFQQTPIKSSCIRLPGGVAWRVTRRTSVRVEHWVLDVSSHSLFAGD